MQPTMDQLKGISLQAALRMALTTTTKTEDDISAEMGWSPSQQARFFKSHDYWPALPNIPRFCRVVGNCVIPMWVMANAECEVQQASPMDVISLLESMSKLFLEMGTLGLVGQKSIIDGKIDQLEAKRLLRNLRDLFTAGYEMVPRLQATIDADK